MLAQHRSHIASTCSTVRQHLDEIRAAVTTAKSPGGAALAPLPEPERARLLAALSNLSALVADMGREFASESGPPTGGPGATRMWVSILLRTCEELIRDLLPEQMQRKYGALEPEEEATVRRRVAALLDAIRHMLPLVGAG